MPIKVAEASVEVAASLDATWKALTTSAVLGHAFFDSKVETDWKAGGPILFRGEWKGKPYEDKGEILTVAPPNELRFSHYSPLSGAPDVPASYHFVTFALSQSGATTVVVLTQENADGKPVAPKEQQDLAKNWATILGRFKEAVEAKHADAR